MSAVLPLPHIACTCGRCLTPMTFGEIWAHSWMCRAATYQRAAAETLDAYLLERGRTVPA